MMVCDKRTKCMVILSMIVGLSNSAQATVFGSDTNVQAAQVFFTFPSGQTDNRLANYGWAPNGFALEDSLTTATFDSVFPVSGSIQINGGTLALNQDLVFRDITTLLSLGTIIGNGHHINFPASVTTFPAGDNVVQACVMYINNDIVLSSSLTFSGTCILNGAGHTIDMSTGDIVIASGSNVTIINAVIKNIGGTNIQCADNTSVLNLNNIIWRQNDTYIFEAGNINIINDVDFVGNEIFAYQSTGTLTVASRATWILDDNCTFSYDAAYPNLLQFADSSSSLIFETNALLHATINGLQLTQGTLFVNANSAIGSEVWVVNDTTIDNGVTFGDCTNADNDFVCYIGTGVTLSIDSGSFNFQDINGASWNMQDSLSALFVATNASLNSYQPMNMANSITTFDNNATLGEAPNAPFTGSVTTLGNLNIVSLPAC